MLLPMQDNAIHYAGQAIVMVVADSFERATYAATRVRSAYEADAPELDLDKASRRYKPKSYCGMEPLQLSTGDPDTVYYGADVRLERNYETPAHFHCAIARLSTVASGKNATARIS